jgi:hypothetical protein
MGFNIEIDYDTVDNILVDILKNQYKSLKEDLQNRIDGKEAFGIFSSDREKDIAKIKKYLKGFEKVLKYNMVEKEFKEFKNGTNEV